MTITGGCLCGDIRYEIGGDSIWTGACHCRWCQRQSGAPFVAFAMFRAEDLRWTNGKVMTYASSPEVERGFCPRCGSMLTFARPARNEISVATGSLDDPNRIEPSEHISPPNKQLGFGGTTGCRAMVDFHPVKRTANQWYRTDKSFAGYGQYPPIQDRIPLIFDNDDWPSWLREVSANDSQLKRFQTCDASAQRQPRLIGRPA